MSEYLIVNDKDPSAPPKYLMSGGLGGFAIEKAAARVFPSMHDAIEGFKILGDRAHAYAIGWRIVPK